MKKHPMIRAVYRFHVCYHMRRVLKRLQTPLPHETGFNTADNPYTESEFFKICEDYGVPNDPIKYQDEKFYWSYQRGVHWPDDYIGPDSMMRWIIEKSVGFTDVGLLRISESIWSGTVGYNNKILVSNKKFSLGKNDEVNALELAKVIALEPSITAIRP